MYDICCVGHITSDEVITPGRTAYLPGGTAYYFSKAISKLPVSYLLVTAIAESEMKVVDDLRSGGVEVQVLPSKHSVNFVNIYGDDPDHRTQRVHQKADPFLSDQLSALAAKIFHLGPLLADDMQPDLIKLLASKGKVSLDVQGYLREVRAQEVHAVHWPDSREVLPYVNILKANEHELEVLTGLRNVQEGALLLASWGVAEVVITLGSQGSVICADDKFYNIPAYKPTLPVDATGCGDTYMAGYLCQRSRGISIPQAGRFAAAMATMKLEKSGPFTGTENDIYQFLSIHNKL